MKYEEILEWNPTIAVVAAASKWWMDGWMGNDEMIVLLFQYGTAQVVKYSVRIFLLVDVVKTRKKEKRTRIKIKFKEFYFKYEK